MSKSCEYEASVSFRTAGDSSQLSAALWHPPTPEKEEVEEELCVEKVVGNLPEATPFFDHGNKILVKGGQVGV